MSSYNEENLKCIINIRKKRGRNQQVPSLPKQCYMGKLSITKAKYADLK